MSNTDMLNYVNYSELIPVFTYHEGNNAHVKKFIKSLENSRIFYILYCKIIYVGK